MTQFCGTIPIDCSECADVSAAPCQSVINLAVGLTPSTQYYLWIRDRFSNLYFDLITVGIYGSVDIDTANFPAGMFETSGVFFDIFITSDSNGVDIIPLNVNPGVTNNCIILSIT